MDEIFIEINPEVSLHGVLKLIEREVSEYSLGDDEPPCYDTIKEIDLTLEGPDNNEARMNFRRARRQEGRQGGLQQQVVRRHRWSAADIRQVFDYFGHKFRNVRSVRLCIDSVDDQYWGACALREFSKYLRTYHVADPATMSTLVVAPSATTASNSPHGESNRNDHQSIKHVDLYISNTNILTSEVFQTLNATNGLESIEFKAASFVDFDDGPELVPLYYCNHYPHLLQCKSLKKLTLDVGTIILLVNP